MALSMKREGVKQVPWFSRLEWLRTYKRIYSNDANKQTEAYKTLLVWKARIPKLPIGVDCTLTILQVSLRDREWMPKIYMGRLPVQYEDDLCLMYSATIMRFLNHISNIRQTKQVSLYHIAKQLNIPEWIVNLRHDTAHGHELPSIGVLRIAINILLTWLHEEYWAPEADTMRDIYVKEAKFSEVDEPGDARAFFELLELWTVVGLYLRVGYRRLHDIPDVQLQETLQGLHDYTCALSVNENKKSIHNGEADHLITIKNDLNTGKEASLKISQAILLTEISKYLGKNKFTRNREDTVLNVLLDNEVFIPNFDLLTVFIEGEDNLHINDIPIAMIQFWQDIIVMLDDQKLLESLILKLIALGQDQRETEYKRRMATLWVKTIAQSFVKMEIAHSILGALERKFEESDKRIPTKLLHLKVIEETDRSHPSLKNALWLRMSNVVPHCFTDKHLLRQLVLNINDAPLTCIQPILDLVRPKLSSGRKKSLMKLIEIYRMKTYLANNGNITGKVYSERELREICSLRSIDDNTSDGYSQDARPLADQTFRSNVWQMASGDCNWVESSPGLLPWQVDTWDMLKTSETIPLECDFTLLESEIIPGIVDNDNLKMQSQINWANVFREKGIKKKEARGNTDIMMNRAIDIVKKVIK